MGEKEKEKEAQQFKLYTTQQRDGSNHAIVLGDRKSSGDRFYHEVTIGSTAKAALITVFEDGKMAVRVGDGDGDDCYVTLGLPPTKAQLALVRKCKDAQNRKCKDAHLKNGRQRL